MADNGTTGAINFLVGGNFSPLLSGMTNTAKSLQGMKVNLPVVTNTQDLENAKKQIEEISKKGTIQDVITKGKVVKDKDTGEEFRIITEQIVKMKDAAGKAYQETIKFNKAIDPKKFEVLKTYKFSENAAASAKAFSDELTRGGNQIVAFGTKAEKWMATASNMTGKEAEEAKKLGASLIQLEVDYKKAYNAGSVSKMQELILKSRELNKEFDIQVARTKGVAAAFRSWTNVLGNAIKQTVAYSFSLGGVREITKFVQDAIRFTIDLNKEMVKIQALGIAGAETASEIESLGLSYTHLAQSLGATTLEIARGSVEWLRQGRTIEETMKLMESTMMLSKLGAIESGQATEYLTAITNAYNISVGDTVGVVDKLVAVDNIAATSAGELATALRYTATTAQQAGVSLDELISYVAAVSSTTRGSAESIGQAFKTIFSRMQDVKDGFDGGADSINKIDYALKKVGITLLDDNNEWRNNGTVLEELSAKWTNLTEVQQNEIAKAVAGVRQRETFLVLMNNMNDAVRYQAEELVKTGIAADRYKTYMGGIEASSNTLKASLEELYQGMINSETLVFINDLATSFVDLINTIGGLKQVLIPVIGLLALANVSTGVEGVLKLINGLNSLEGVFRKLGTTAGRKDIWGNILGTNDADYAKYVKVLTVGTKEYNAELIQQTAIKQKLATVTAGEDLKEGKRLILNILKLKVSKQEKEALIAQLIVEQSHGEISEENAKTMAVEIVAKKARVGVEKQVEIAIEKVNHAIDENTQKAILNNEVNSKSPTIIQRVIGKFGGMDKIIQSVSSAFAKLSIAAIVYSTAVSALNKLNSDNIDKLVEQNKQMQELVDNYAKLESAEATNVKKQFLLLQARKNTVGLTKEEQETFDSLALSLKSLYGDNLTLVETEIGHFSLSGIKSLEDFDTKTKEVSKSVSEKLLSMAKEVRAAGIDAESGIFSPNETDQIIAWQGRTARGKSTGGESRLLSAGFGETKAADIMSYSPFEAVMRGGKSELELFLRNSLGQIDEGAAGKLSTDAGNQISEIYNAAIESGLDKSKALEMAKQYNTDLFSIMLRYAPNEKSALEDIFDVSLGQLDAMILEKEQEALQKTKVEGYITQARGELGIADSVQVFPVESLSQASDYINKVYDDLGKIADKYGNKPIVKEMFNAEELGSLYDNYPDLLDMMDKEENAGLTMNEILEKYVKLKKDGMDVTLKAQMIALEEKKTALETQLGTAEMARTDAWGTAEEEVVQGIRDEIEATQTDIEVKQLLINKINEITAARQAEVVGMDALVSKIGSIKSATDEYNSTGQISIQTALEMIKNGNASALVFDNNSGKIQLNTVALQQNMIAELQTARATAVEAIASANAAFAKDNESLAINENTRQLWMNVEARKADLALIDAMIGQVSAGDFRRGFPGGGGGGGGETPEQTAAKDRIKKLEEEKKKLQKRLAEYKKYIDLKKEELKLQKEEKEYLDAITKKTKSLAKIKSTIALLSLDDSEEARARRLELEEEALNMEEEITQDTEDRKYDLQVQALDDMSRKFEESINKQIEALDKQIEKLNEVAQAASGGGGGSVGGAYNTLSAQVDQVTQNIIDKLNQQGLKLDEVTQIKLEGMIQKWLLAGDTIDIATDKAWAFYQSIMASAAAAVSFNNAAGNTLASLGSWHEGGIVETHHEGGVAGKSIKKPEVHHEGNFAGNLRSNEVFAKLLQGEYVATEGQMDNFLKNVLPKIAMNFPRTEKANDSCINISMPINVNGSLDKTVVPDLEKIIQKTIKEINNTMKARGYIRPTSQTSI